MRPSLLRLASSAAAFVCATLIVAPVLAEDLLVKSGTEVRVDGTIRYKNVTVEGDGRLIVRGLTSGEPGTGTLTIKAETVTVQFGGTIDASAAGYTGTSSGGNAPACCASAGGGAGPAGGESAPGGGGASGGDGAPGCPGGGPGGTKYMSPSAGNPGAAGGAAFRKDAMAGEPSLGGRGGGAITILATTVTIDGKVLADGAPGLAYGGVGTGGGAGGFISIDATKLLGVGLLSAKGGGGGVGFSGKGGGGGGGVIQISVAEPLQTDGVGALLPLRDVTGGTTGCAGAQEGISDVKVDPGKPCADADRDGVCAGPDCDDSDPTVYGGTSPALEVCDGLDNDCDMSTDEGLVKDACAEGQVCMNGECVTEGSGSGGGVSPDPDYLDYRGACDIGASRSANGAAVCGAAILGVLAGLRAYRKRRRS